MIKQFMKNETTTNNTNFDRLENLPQMKAIDFSNTLSRDPKNGKN